MTSLAKQPLERGDIPKSATEAVLPRVFVGAAADRRLRLLWSLGFGVYVAVLFGFLYNAFGGLVLVRTVCMRNGDAHHASVHSKPAGEIGQYDPGTKDKDRKERDGCELRTGGPALHRHPLVFRWLATCTLRCRRCRAGRGESQSHWHLA